MTAVDESVSVESLLDKEDPNDIVKAFARNPAFRAAEWEELTTEDDPFRRPVRPDDLDWLDYGKPMPVAKVLRLSGLLGHRMLRNIYDAELLYVEPRANTAADTDRANFYSARNRALGELAKPILQRHLFTFLDAEREPLATPELATLIDYVQDYRARREATPSAGFDAALATKDRREAATFSRPRAPTGSST
jgi:hypothetical protein